MPKLLNHKRVDWHGLFLYYDTNNSGSLEMPELGIMMREAGMTYATDVEIGFAWGIIAMY